MYCLPDEGVRINSFALVSYIPGPLGLFLDGLRQELIPSCVAKSHVTSLPPRALAAGADVAQEWLAAALPDLTAFELSLDGIEVFESTSVIYIGIGAGMGELKRIHERLNRGPLAAEEPHGYHPHVTLAQDFPPQELGDMVQVAKERWASFTGPRSFCLDRVTFVQNTTANLWADLADFPLEDKVLVT